MNWLHWDDPEGWDGEEGGRGFQDGEHMYTHGWFMSMYGTNHYNIVISLQLNLKKKRNSEEEIAWTTVIAWFLQK